MSGAIPPLPQYALIAWCSVKAQGQLHLLLLLGKMEMAFVQCSPRLMGEKLQNIQCFGVA